MVAKFSVGPSSYGDLRRVRQFVASARMALQVLSVMVDFNNWQKARGATGKLSVNEGMRSRARQSWFWANRFVLGIAVAPPFTSRHDEVNHGNAVDFGITMPDGSNRALTTAEFAMLHAIVESRGGTWTGANFGEPWHHEMATRAERLAPYPNAADLYHGVAAKPSKSTIKKPTVPAVITSPGGMLMLFKAKYYYLVGEFTVQKFTAKADAVPYSQATKRATKVTSDRMNRIIRQTAERRQSTFGSIDADLQKLIDDRNL
ncbi:hypothetical protein [Curtobacterium sp. VKM Ac-2884]|uniref:hypothetical protein n=1 Tax=Curtobacterium sp. VKM Ac-2884 TaxID=2783818 RepID=UPI00188B9E2F|nr:hypothetical protein [Curtobacterium sp. VKM Ac-2884]MBF4602844.1 hypothetical protein [Curtobacterium sp. VKM Ac-2884]